MFNCFVVHVSDLMLEPTPVIAAFNTVYFCVQRPVASAEGEYGELRGSDGRDNGTQI